MHNKFKGIYAPYIKLYIDFKRSLGFKYKTEATIFTYFDQFTIKRAEKIIGITRDLAEAWSKLNSNESSSYKYHRCGCLNQLASYLCKIGFPSYALQLPRNKSTFTPHIFSGAQIAALFKACDSVCSCNADHVRKWFKKILGIAGISLHDQGPRLHDLRHTFSVHSLAMMAEAGIDLYCSLPTLSTYLGHQSLEATNAYVRLTAEMYPGLLKDVDLICLNVFPNNEYHATH